MTTLPASAPKSVGEAFAHINAVTSPTIDDLKLMAYLEASGLEGYYGLAAGTENAEIKALLQANGREELAHAHRVAKVVTLLSGETFVPPAAADNPYVSTSTTVRPLERRILESLVAAEENGDALYETWAKALGDGEAAELLRQNGREEIRHAERVSQALALLDA
jgi:rubrerythrin